MKEYAKVKWEYRDYIPHDAYKLFMSKAYACACKCYAKINEKFKKSERYRSANPLRLITKKEWVDNASRIHWSYDKENGTWLRPMNPRTLLPRKGKRVASYEMIKDTMGRRRSQNHGWPQIPWGDDQDRVLVQEIRSDKLK